MAHYFWRVTQVHMQTTIKLNDIDSPKSGATFQKLPSFLGGKLSPPPVSVSLVSAAVVQNQRLGQTGARQPTPTIGWLTQWVRPPPPPSCDRLVMRGILPGPSPLPGRLWTLPQLPVGGGVDVNARHPISGVFLQPARSSVVEHLRPLRVWNGLDQSAGFIIQSCPGGFGLDWISNSPTQRILNWTGSRNVQCVSLI